MDEEIEKKTSCSSEKKCGCCGSSKLLAGVLLGIVLTLAAIGFCKMSACGGRMKQCPLSQSVYK